MYAQSYNEDNLPNEIPVGRAINLTGKRYGRLTVLYRCDPPSTVSTKSTQTYWLCKCDCGKYIATRTGALNTNGVKSCGCLQKEASARVKPGLGHSPTNKLDLSGQQFGWLTPEYSFSIKYRSYWHCKCKCGNYRDVLASHLTSGRVVSCGCQTMSRGELAIRSWLNDHDFNYQQEYIFDDLIGVNSGKLRFDFAVFDANKKIKCLIEFQGAQHYDKNNPWYTIELTQNDKIKKDYCKQHNLQLIEILYNENIYNKLNSLLLR